MWQVYIKEGDKYRRLGDLQSGFDISLVAIHCSSSIIGFRNSMVGSFLVEHQIPAKNMCNLEPLNKIKCVERYT